MTFSMLKNIDADNLILLAQVARQPSLSQAAQYLTLSVSTLSRRLSALEEQVGVALLVRHSKGVQLTEEGQAILVYADAMLLQLESVERYLAATTDQPHGHLKIALPATIGVTVLNELIALYKQQCPQVTLDIQFTDRVIDPRLEDYDVVFSIVGETPLPDSNLVAKKIASPKTVLVCSPDYPCDVTSPVDLEGVDCVATLAKEQPMINWYLTKYQQSLRVYPKPAILVNNIDAVKEAILKGFGVGHLVYAFCEREIQSGELITLLDDWHVQAWEVYAIYPSRKHLPKKTERFVQLVSDWAQKRYQS